jgi:hypothetical protein
VEAKRQQVVEETVRQLLEQTRLREDEVTSHLGRALNPVYWERLNPDLSVSESATGEGIEATAIELEQQNEIVRKFAQEGYLQIEPILSASVIERMRDAIEVLRKNDWPPVFTYVYDQFWLVSRVPSLVRVLSAILGPGYKQIPHIWTHYVQPCKGAGGWPPHVDGPGRSIRVTVWIGLNDATLENGCIYLIPKHQTPEKIAQNFTKIQSIEWSDMRTLMHHTQALPVRTGTILGWDFQVIHWGSICNQIQHPRISISQEFIGENIKPHKDEIPLLDVHSSLPTFSQRLQVISQAILAYERFEPLLIRYTELAQRLIKGLGIG